MGVPKNEGLLQETQHIIKYPAKQALQEMENREGLCFFCLTRSLLNSLDHYFRQLLQAFGSSQQK